MCQAFQYPCPLLNTESFSSNPELGCWLKGVDFQLHFCRAVTRLPPHLFQATAHSSTRLKKRRYVISGKRLSFHLLAFPFYPKGKEQRRLSFGSQVADSCGFGLQRSYNSRGTGRSREACTTAGCSRGSEEEMTNL